MWYLKRNVDNYMKILKTSLRQTPLLDGHFGLLRGVSVLRGCTVNKEIFSFYHHYIADKSTLFFFNSAESPLHPFNVFSDNQFYLDQWCALMFLITLSQSRQIGMSHHRQKYETPIFDTSLGKFRLYIFFDLPRQTLWKE